MRTLSFWMDFLFQSTPSAWRVTVWFIAICTGLEISIHTLRVEGDFVMTTALKSHN